MSSAGGRALLDEYASDHQARGNELCHFVGIPLIVAALLGLASRVPLYPGAPAWLDLAVLVVVAAFAFHWRLDRLQAVGTLTCSLATVWLVDGFPAGVLLAGLVVGWCFQLVGHACFERRRPSFTRRPIHLLVGPLWLAGRGLGLFRPRASEGAEVRP